MPGLTGSVSTLHRCLRAACRPQDDWRAGRYTYGLYGTPTVLELGARVADLRGAPHSFVVPGSQAALVPESAYGPNQELGLGILGGLGITVETYAPTLGADIANLIRPETAIIWCESPGSVTMEVVATTRGRSPWSPLRIKRRSGSCSISRRMGVELVTTFPHDTPSP
jgi:cystathionine beta-lyase/cystathionine gamma-synthase